MTKIIDTSLRDGNQSLWATRMTTEMMEPILGVLDSVGYESVEVMSSVQMDACVRYLGENPWDRMRLCRDTFTNTPLRMLGMSQFFSISHVLPDDVVDLFTRTCAQYLDIQWITASMNDVRTIEVPIKAALEAGNQVEGGVQFTVSPVHTDEFFVGVVKELVSLGVHGIVLKDAGGLLTPERLKKLFPAILAASNNLPVRVHSHCTTGLGPASNLEAANQGATAVWTSTPVLANGASLPSGSLMYRSLKWMGHDVDLDEEAMEHIDEHFASIARIAGLPTGVPAEYDPKYYAHQIPGGMISNFRAQLRERGEEGKLAAVLEEMPRVREELGFPNIQTPFSQFVATQALLNVLYGRYEVVPDDIRRFVLGYWGRTPGPIDPDVLDKVGKGESPVTDRPGGLAEPLLDRVQKELGPFSTNEDLLLATLFMPELLQKMQVDQQKPKQSWYEMNVHREPNLVELIRQLGMASDVHSVSVTINDHH